MGKKSRRGRHGSGGGGGGKKKNSKRGTNGGNKGSRGDVLAPSVAPTVSSRPKYTTMSEVRLILDAHLKGRPRGTPVEPSRWNEHDEKLMWYGDLPDSDYDDDSDGEDKLAGSKPEGAEGTIEALSFALKSAYDTWSSTGSGKAGTCDSVAPRKTYVRWATELAKHPERIQALLEEYLRDTEMHAELLERLRMFEIFDHIRARNCIFHDTFARCHLPSPPGLEYWAYNDQCALMNHFDEDEYVYDAFDRPNGIYEGSCDELFIKAWNAYQALAFALVDVVKEHPLEGAKAKADDLSDIVPATDRGDITPLIRSKDGDYPYWDYYDDEDYDSDQYGGDWDDLLAQGVKPWDDDAGAVLQALNGW